MTDTTTALPLLKGLRYLADSGKAGYCRKCQGMRRAIAMHITHGEQRLPDSGFSRSPDLAAQFVANKRLKRVWRHAYNR